MELVQCNTVVVILTSSGNGLRLMETSHTPSLDGSTGVADRLTTLATVGSSEGSSTLGRVDKSL
jgi:hypothetical protein